MFFVFLYFGFSCLANSQNKLEDLIVGVIDGDLRITMTTEADHQIVQVLHLSSIMGEIIFRRIDDRHLVPFQRLLQRVLAMVDTLGIVARDVPKIKGFLEILLDIVLCSGAMLTFATQLVQVLFLGVKKALFVLRWDDRSRQMPLVRLLQSSLTVLHTLGLIAGDVPLELGLLAAFGKQLERNHVSVLSKLNVQL